MRLTVDDDATLTVHRYRDAMAIYGLMLGGLAVPLVLLLVTSPRQWDVIGVILMVMAGLLRYLAPVRASVLRNGQVRFTWPLRTVTIRSGSLVTARVLPNAINHEPILALRVQHGARFGAFSSRWTNAPDLARALSQLVVGAEAVPERDRRASLAMLHTAAKRNEQGGCARTWASRASTAAATSIPAEDRCTRGAAETTRFQTSAQVKHMVFPHYWNPVTGPMTETVGDSIISVAAP